MRRPLLALLTIILLLTLYLTQPAASAGKGDTFAPGAHVRFEHLTIDDGLSQNAGLALLQDSQGYLWIGTQDGLNRYDGYTITQFKHDLDDPFSISFNSIIALYEDRNGAIWIGTWGGGLNKYDRKTGIFTRFNSDPSNLASLIVTAIFQDEGDTLWVGTLDGLARFEPESGRLIHYHHSPTDSHSLSSNAISVIAPAPNGKLWIGTGAFSTSGAGLNLFDPASGKAQRYPTSGECLGSPNISDILPEADGSLWIAYGGYGVAGGGLDRYNPITGACAHFDNPLSSNNQITDNNLTDLMFDRAGVLWVTSWASGVLRMTPDGIFSGIHHNPADPEGLSNNNTFSLLEDRSGVIWIGTLSAGINKLDPDTLQFRTYRNDAGNPNSLPSNHIGAFTQTSDGILWVGTWERGLARFDPERGAFTIFSTEPDNPNSISSDLVMSLHADRDGTLWAGTLGGGLNHFDPKQGTFTHYINNPADATSLLENQVTTILHDSSGRLWVGNFAGLSRLDPGADGFVNYPMPAPPVSLKVIGQELWIGTWGGGVYRLNLSQPTSLDQTQADFSNLVHDPANPGSLSNNGVWTIHQSQDGVVWVGTEGGLNRYDGQTGQFKAYTEKHGLLSTTILGILEDAAGYLWVTTNNGLAKFDPRTETFQIYDKSKGLQGNEYSSNAYFQTRTGDFLIGGVTGFTIFDPLLIRQNETPPPVVITQFSVFNTPTPFDPTGTDPIQLNFDQDFISFEFAALDFRAPQLNQYAYKLDGFDEQWVQAGTRNYASYTNLPGGEYTFRVRAANSDGVWNEAGTAIQLRVTPPVWQTWPFRVGLLVGSIALVSLGYQWRMRSVRDQNARLQRLLKDQQRVEAELRESEERFRTVFETSAIGIGLMGLDRKVINANPALCQMFGYNLEELLGQTAVLVLHPDEYERSLKFTQDMLDGKINHYTDERRYIRKNGEIFWARVTMNLVRDVQGEPRYFLGMVTDINQQRTALARLQESEARFRAMYENAAIGISLIAPDGQVLAVNPVLVRLSGRSETELIALGGQGITLAEDREVGRQEFYEIIKGVRDTFQVEKRYVHKDGRVQWMRQSISAVRDTEGRALYLIVIAEDIDERKRAVEELRESEARFRAMYNNAAVGMAMTTMDRRVISVNETSTRITGYSAEELINLDASSLSHPDDAAIGQEQLAELAAGIIPQLQMEKRFIRKNGDCFWGRVSYSVVPGSDGKPEYMVGLIEDIDMERQAQERLAVQEAEYRGLLEKRIAERTEELNQANEQLREKAAQDAVAAERTRLARDLHDAVTQTLFSATLIAEVLPDIWAMNPNEGKRRLEEVRQLTRGALAEMRTLLVELRPNALVDVPLPTLLRQLAEALTGRTRMDIQFTVEGERRLPAEVQVGLYRIAQEALNNVVKHAKSTQALVHLYYGATVRLTVADNGAGFDPATVTADHLGLKIMRERAEAIGARFILYSEPGEGTQISVQWDIPTSSLPGPLKKND